MKEITVVICTRNRYENFRECINSILKNRDERFKILVVDQSTNNRSQKFIEEINSPIIDYIKTDTKGLSRARNIAIANVKTKYLVFTDDDCIVDSKWIENILKEYREDIDGVYGRVLPYGNGEKKGYFCHCVIESEKRVEVNRPVIPHNYLGHGNNMSFKIDVFKEVGGYNEKLGAGTKMKSGEDTDLIYRVLKKRKKIIYSPEPLVYHNSWKTLEEAERLDFGYVRGFVTIFSKFAFKGDMVAVKALILKFYSLLKDIKGALRYKNYKKVLTTLRKFFIFSYSIPLGIYFLIIGDPEYEEILKKYGKLMDL